MAFISARDFNLKMTLPDAAVVGVIVVLVGLALAFARNIEIRYRNKDR
jgi:hypothetical protein